MKKICVIMLLILMTMYMPTAAIAESSGFVSRLDVCTGLFAAIWSENKNITAEPSVSLYKFSDIQGLDAWQKAQISFLIDNGILSGYNDNTLRLEENITRLEVAVMLERSAAFFADSMIFREYNNTYTDVPDWGKSAVNYCYSHGFMIGYSNIFGSGDSITAEQLSIVLSRIKSNKTTLEKLRFYETVGKCNLKIEEAMKTANNPEIAFDKSEISNYSPNSVEPINSEIIELFSKMVDINFSFDYSRTMCFDEKWIEAHDFYNSIDVSEYSKLMTEHFQNMRDRKISQDCFFVTDINNGGVILNGTSRMSACKGYLYFIRYMGTDSTIGKIPLLDTDTSNDSIVENGKWYRRKVVLRCSALSASSGLDLSFNGSYAQAIEKVPDDLLYNPET